MTATRQAFTSSGGGSTFAGVYDITASPYNATTGASDNTTAIQAAITAAKATGGTVYVPPGVFKYASPLICDQNTKGFSIVGAGGGVGDISDPPSELRYTGTTSPAISCHSVFSFSLKYLRFTYDNAAFTGDLVDIDGGPHAADCTNWSIVGCGSLKAVAGSFTARSIVRMQKAINGIIQDCGFGGAVNCLRMGDPGITYVVGVKVTNTTFNNSTNAHILIGSPDGENLIIDNNRFEAGTNTTAIRGATVAVDGGACGLYVPVISNNWYGDAGSATKWIDSLGIVGSETGVISGNRFADCINGTHVTVNGKWLLINNGLEGGTAIDSGAPTSLHITSIGNAYQTTRIFPVSFSFAAGSPSTFTSLHDIGSAALGLDALNQSLGIRANTPTFNAGTDMGLVLAAQLNAGYATLPNNTAAIYRTGVSALPALALHAPDSGVDGSVMLVAGASGAGNQVVHVQRAKLGLYGVAPVAQASRAGQLTDSTGGTVTSTLAAGITDAVAKNAIASLAAKVNALETIIHNLGVSA